MDDLPNSLEEAKVERDQVAKWLESVSQQIPVSQARGLFLNGFIAALEAVELLGDPQIPSD